MSKIPLVLVLLAAACGTPDSISSDPSEEIESLLYQTSKQALLLREADLVTECGRENGLDGFVFPVESLLPTPIVFDAGLIGRERAEAIGTGEVEMTKAKQEIASQSAPPGPQEEPSAQERLLNSGPVDTPGGGSYNGGCIDWAREQVSDTQLTEARTALEQAYGITMESEYIDSPEYLQLEQDWLACMTEAGFGGLNERADANEIVRDAIDRWSSGTISYEEALAVDQDVGLAWHDCQSEIQDDADALANAVAERFTSEHPDDIERLRVLSEAES